VGESVCVRESVCEKEFLSVCVCVCVCECVRKSVFERECVRERERERDLGSGAPGVGEVVRELAVCCPGHQVVFCALTCEC